MNIEEELAREVREFLPGADGEADSRTIAAALMPLVKRAQAEAEARALRNFRASLIRDQMIRYGIVLPDVDDIVEALDEQADRIESEVPGV